MGQFGEDHFIQIAKVLAISPRGKTGPLYQAQFKMRSVFERINHSGHFELRLVYLRLCSPGYARICKTLL